MGMRKVEDQMAYKKGWGYKKGRGYENDRGYKNGSDPHSGLDAFLCLQTCLQYLRKDTPEWRRGCGHY